MEELGRYAWVGAGGFLGAVARYGVANIAAGLFGASFPWGTFIVNISGSFALGLAATLIAERLVPYPDALRLAVAVGFIGSYTTFATLEYETGTLLDDAGWAMALANVLGSVVAGFIALKLGILIARRLG